MDFENNEMWPAVLSEPEYGRQAVATGSESPAPRGLLASGSILAAATFLILERTLAHHSEDAGFAHKFFLMRGR
jgi:hypothetical protein